MMVSECLVVPSRLRDSETPISKLAKQSDSKMLNNYKYIRKLGEGYFAKVQLYQHTKSKKKVAVKKLTHQKLASLRIGTSKFTAADCAKEELRVLKELQHPNLVWLHEVIDDACGDIYLVTEYYPNGSLGDEIRRINKEKKGSLKLERPTIKGFSTWQARLVFLDLLKALHYCHKVVGVVHRDIKPDNVMINKTGDAVLIDFGLVANYSMKEDEDNEYANLKAGSYMFFAPELFSKELYPFGPQTDIWALGITMYYVLTGHPPWRNCKSIIKLAETISEQPIDFSEIQSEMAKRCVERMLDKNPKTRFTIE